MITEGINIFWSLPDSAHISESLQLLDKKGRKV